MTMSDVEGIIEAWKSGSKGEAVRMSGGIGLSEAVNLGRIMTDRIGSAEVAEFVRQLERLYGRP